MPKPEAGQRRLEKAVELYQHLNEVQQVFDFEREQRMKHIHS